MATEQQKTYANDTAVDFVIVGSGSAGGIIARELSSKGFDVVVLEQGPFRQAGDFTHDEIDVTFNGSLMGGPAQRNGQTFRADENATAEPASFRQPAEYAATVGGSSVHYSGNYWRFRESDFKERSLLGPISGTNFADWPISYDELEPYYTRVDWEIGVSGAPGPFDAPRSKPYPVPPMPIKSSGALLEKAAHKLGMHPQVAPVAILSKPHNGRPGCIHCGYCMGFGCEVGAKSSTLATVIPQAVATGRCEIRPLSTVFRINTNAAGKAEEVLYYDAGGSEQTQKAKAVILSANGAETPRLLLDSASARHPDGLANSSGFVGRNLMFNCHSLANGVFEEQLNDYKSIQVTRIIHDYYESDPERGFYGGGGIDARPLFSATPILYAMAGMAPDTPRWGKAFKDAVAQNYTRQMCILGSTTSLAVERNNITLDPTHKDQWGRAALRMTYRDHDDDLAMAAFLQDRAMELFDAAGARQAWRYPVEAQTGGAHLLGTCRMGDDPQTSVVDRNHRSHDVSNLFICDGSSFVTSGRGQPTLTIMALAFRAAEKIAAAASANDV
ncbi:MAG: GMC family oxidoreductase [Woeseia sp.]|nr:GMC family oxidoreductase [Woeseia sp.]MBT8096461.1 GMC family oxidoreductase [Woeseia sp.]NNE62104.1 GMC family oxidoreductase [Woeseia sp.]NNL55308.1 GMC family oxidoreductase [Woeseia sp.]